MPTAVTLPLLGDSAGKGTVSRWLKRVGDPVTLGEAIVEISTDKVDAQLPSPVSGVIVEIQAQEAQSVSVGSILAVIQEHVPTSPRSPFEPSDFSVFGSQPREYTAKAVPAPEPVILNPPRPSPAEPPSPVPPFTAPTLRTSVPPPDNPRSQDSLFLPPRPDVPLAPVPTEPTQPLPAPAPVPSPVAVAPSEPSSLTPPVAAPASVITPPPTPELPPTPHVPSTPEVPSVPPTPAAPVATPTRPVIPSAWFTPNQGHQHVGNANHSHAEDPGPSIPVPPAPATGPGSFMPIPDFLAVVTQAATPPPGPVAPNISHAAHVGHASVAPLAPASPDTPAPVVATTPVSSGSPAPTLPDTGVSSPEPAPAPTDAVSVPDPNSPPVDPAAEPSTQEAPPAPAPESFEADPIPDIMLAFPPSQPSAHLPSASVPSASAPTPVSPPPAPIASAIGSWPSGPAESIIPVELASQETIPTTSSPSGTPEAGPVSYASASSALPQPETDPNGFPATFPASLAHTQGDTDTRWAPTRVEPVKTSTPSGSYVTPLVRKLAEFRGVDLATVVGTGVGGRIRKKDVEEAARALQSKKDIANAVDKDSPSDSDKPSEEAASQETTPTVDEEATPEVTEETPEAPEPEAGDKVTEEAADPEESIAVEETPEQDPQADIAAESDQLKSEPEPPTDDTAEPEPTSEVAPEAAVLPAAPILPTPPVPEAVAPETPGPEQQDIVVEEISESAKSEVPPESRPESIQVPAPEVALSATPLTVTAPPAPPALEVAAPLAPVIVAVPPPPVVIAPTIILPASRVAPAPPIVAVPPSPVVTAPTVEPASPAGMVSNLLPQWRSPLHPQVPSILPVYVDPDPVDSTDPQVLAPDLDEADDAAGATEVLNASTQAAPVQLTSVIEVDVTAIARLRTSVGESFRATHGFDLTYMPFVARAIAEALTLFPKFNATIDSATGIVAYSPSAHLNVTMTTSRGTSSPVVHDAGDLSVTGLASRIRALSARASEGQSTENDLVGGTFTVADHSTSGTLMDTPIIAPPQVAILSVGSISKRPIVLEDPRLGDIVAVRDMTYLSLSYDRRVITASDAAQFLGTIKARLEDGDFGAEF